MKIINDIVAFIEIASFQTFLVGVIIIFIVWGIIIVVYHIIKNKFLKEQTRRLNTALQVNQTKDEFISMVLHNLRTPLTAIRWGLEIILNELSSQDSKKKDLEILHQESSRTLNAVEHLIEASKVSIERVNYQFEVITLSELQRIIKENLNVFEVKIKEKGIKIEREFLPVSESLVKIDKDKIIITIQTLIKNSLFYTKNGLISITTEEKGSEFLFSISDTGIGISKEDEPRIFLQFFRGKNARLVFPGGFGIDLYLAKAFLQKHDGKIWFTSKENKGTTFIFSLPIFSSSTEKSLG